MEFCLECGIQNDATANHCKNCGATLSVKPAKGSSPVEETPAKNISPAPTREETTISCPSCFSTNPKGMNFCGSCGNDLSSPSSASTNHIFCGECGAKNSKTSSFCGSCGKSMQLPVQSQSPSASSQSANWSRSTPTSQTPGYGRSTYQTRPQTGYTPNQRQRNTSRGRKSSALALILSFIVPGFGSMYVDKGGRGVLILIAVIILFPFGIGILIYIWQIIDSVNQVDNYNENL